jgi:hypothetical protein
MFGALSDEGTDLSFTNDLGSRQRSHSPVRVPRVSFIAGRKPQIIA